MDKILMWKRYTNSGFKLMKFANPFPPASLLHFLLFKGFQPGSMFCHLLGAQRLVCLLHLPAYFWSPFVIIFNSCQH